MKKLFFVFLFLPLFFGFTWTDQISTLISNTTIGASSSSEIEIVLGSRTTTVSVSGTTGTLTSTAGLFNGMTAYNHTDSEFDSIESLDSEGTITFETGPTEGSGKSFTFSNLNDYISIYCKLVGDSSADSATMSIYSSGDGGTTWTSTAHYSEDIENLASATRTIVYKVSAHMYPLIKVVVENNTVESGSNDDIVATITLAGYDN